MDKFDRIQKLHRILRSHRNPVPLRSLADKLECSERTVRRLIETMKLQLDAPIEYDSTRNGWHYADDTGTRFELPGLWLTGDELQSLSLLLNLLENLGNTLLNQEISVIEAEIDKLLRERGISPSAFAERIRILPVGNRQLPGTVFHTVSEALLRNRQLDIRYTSYAQRQTRRSISPQTLVHYRENWYLDAWCHLRGELRTFSIARISRAEILNNKAIGIPRVDLQRHFSTSYGIFAGAPEHVARLRFLPGIAREIAMQQWHPAQQGEWDGDEYLLNLPYSDERELVGDILRHSPNIRVEEPTALRETVLEKLQQAIDLYPGEGETT